MTIRELLASCVRRANMLYERHPEPRPSVIEETWRDLEAELDTALAAGDEARARRAIAAWSAHVERELGGAS